MKKIIIALLFLSIITTPVYAISIFDTLVCKKIVLRYNNRTVLVNRVTGEVKYILRNGQWIILTGVPKRECQAMYNAQVSSPKP